MIKPKLVEVRTDLPEFRLIVAGSRDFEDYQLLTHCIEDLAKKDYDQYGVSIVSGMARGADAMAAHFAKEHGVKLYEMPADWSQGRGAGFARNTNMARFSDGLLAFWDNKSPGTKHMIDTMRKMGKPVTVVRF